jgi:hypothetical protein
LAVFCILPYATLVFGGSHGYTEEYRRESGGRPFSKVSEYSVFGYRVYDYDVSEYDVSEYDVSEYDVSEYNGRNDEQEA